MMSWQLPKNFPELQPKEVHVWRAPLICDEQELAGFKKMLNSDERERAARFVVDFAANNFIVARGVLRTLIGHYVSIDPDKIFLNEGEHGKLYLAGSSLQFNLSHSGNLSLFIFSLDVPVGVDVELIRDEYEFKDIVEKFFAKKEIEELFNLPKEEQLLAFFNCWSRKEAFIKGLGLGVFKGLHNFSVEVSGQKVGKVKLLDGDGNKNWGLESIDPGDQYAGAFAVDSSDYIPRFYDFCSELYL